MHRDANNLDGSSNYVMALTDFAKGGIWVQDDEGQHVRAMFLGKATGRVLQVCDNPVEFDAHCFHCTLPWEGSRVVLIGFTPNRVASLKKDDVRVLRDLGFPLPGHPVPVNCATAACPHDQPCKSGETEPVTGPVQQTQHATFGVPFDESEFVRAAVRAGHPSSSLSSLPDHLESCVDMLAKAPPHAVVDKRRRWLDKWTTRACEIERDPDPSWDIDDPHMKRVLCKKRLQLLDEIIAAEGYDDVNLARDIWSGFDLVGTSPVSNVLPGKVTPASLHPDDLCAAAPRANEALKVSLGSSGDREKDILLWEKTMKESDIRPLVPVDAITGIGELETVAVVVAFMLWSQHLASSECMAYLDNEGARFALIKGYSASSAVTRVCHVFAKACEQNTLVCACTIEQQYCRCAES
ncbi:unnamed protein product [Symbiodinium sp. CCMP2592]|nr:unnamed protein product [Symbiodinium sp. CCMP2592]